MKSKFSIEIALETLRILKFWTAKGKQFTCFDVSRKLRNCRHDVNHEETKKFVHALHGLKLLPLGSAFSRGYERVTATFTTSRGVSETAELYKRIGDLRAYNPDSVSISAGVVLGKNSKPEVFKPKPKKPVVKTKDICKFCNRDRDVCKVGPFKTVTVTTEVPKVVTKPTVKSLKFGVDGRGRLCVRNELTDKLGLTKGSRVYLQKVVEGIRVLTSVPSRDYIGYLTVDKNRNVRVTKHLQLEAGIRSSEFSMSVVDGSVLLTAH